jgi:hypothetical protein
MMRQVGRVFSTHFIHLFEIAKKEAAILDAICRIGLLGFSNTLYIVLQELCLWGGD